ncbi:MAG: hypothetical protein NWF03_02655 [Candidatus Bathyarchaeota archaeon]|nr:hypothetical protein [Candidatus Bathyarchaeota archaeon]
MVLLLGDKRVTAILLLVISFSILVGVHLVLTNTDDTQTKEENETQKLDCTAEEKALAFLTDVVGLNLTGYNVTSSEHEFTFPESGPLSVDLFYSEKQVWVNLESKISNITVSCHFKDEKIEFCRLHIDGLPIYAQTQQTEIKPEAELLLQNYQKYITKYYGSDTSYIKQPLNMIEIVTKIEPLTQTTDNVKFKISINNENETTIEWIYVEDGIDIPKKSLELDFNSGVFCYFRDTWNLYTVGTLESVSEEEAVRLMFEAAKNCSFTYIIDDNTTVEIEPDWSNITYDVWLSVLPRESEKLYPYWRAIFYLEEPIYSTIGVQVGMWGDTKEITDCNGFGYLKGTQTSP